MYLLACLQVVLYRWFFLRDVISANFENRRMAFVKHEIIKIKLTLYVFKGGNKIAKTSKSWHS